MAGLAPRNRYRFDEHGASSAGSSMGKHYVKNNAASIWSPTYGNGVTVIRPYPMWDPTANQWQPYRDITRDPNRNFTDWLRRYDTVNNFGENGVSMIIRDPADPNAPPKEDTPAWVLYRAIDSAITNKQEQRGWAALMKGGKGRGAALKAPGESYFMQAMVLQHKNEQFNPPKGFTNEDKPLVFVVTGGAGNELIRQLNEVTGDPSAHPGDFQRYYVHGDPVGIHDGRYITFYKLEDGDPRQKQQQQVAATQGWQTSNSTNNGGKKEEVIGFGCFLEATFNGTPASLANYEAQIYNKVQQWDDILFFPTIDQQAALIADKFPADAILYAWRDHPHWIPQSVHAKAAAAVTFAPPAGGWPQAGQQGYQGDPGVTAPGMAQNQFGAPQFGAPPQNQFGAPQFGTPPQNQFGAPQFGAPPQQPDVPPQNQFAAPQFGVPPQNQFGAPQFGATPQNQFGAPPAAGVPPQQFAAPQQPQQPQQYGAPQFGAPPQQQFGAPPQQQFGAPPQQQFGAPPQQQFGAPPATMPMQQAPPQQAMPQQQPGQPSPQFPTWATQNAAAPNAMGQTPGGFAPQMPGVPPQQFPPQQAPGMPMQGPAAGIPAAAGRAAMAYGAMQATTGGQPPQ